MPQMAQWPLSGPSKSRRVAVHQAKPTPVAATTCGWQPAMRNYGCQRMTCDITRLGWR